ncbi:uncharacterized protein at1g01500 [Phtheirospermum japonicum]|uniref:Uncharacterized protein at1g01500 n=1 Tax=Phtheirospermum japonicum TaxID=374723 RepID=A0A830CJZ4_9LAMI|nr:uncharacterized protein at1g01500 [Phtheirospermum japonicum]
MDVNEDEILISLRNMRNSDNEHIVFENSHSLASHQPNNIKVSSNLRWLDLKVFYIRVNKCIIDNNDSTPEYLTLNHVPLNRNTLLEVNCVRTSIFSDGEESTLLKRDRLDKRSEEVTFVSTNSIRMTGSVKFEVFNKDVLVLSGILEMCRCNNGCIGESKNQGPRWSMNCEPDVFADNGLLKGNWNQSPAIEVYVAGSFLGNPIILTKTLQLISYKKKKKQMRKGMLECIPEYDAAQTIPLSEHSEYKQEEEGQISPYLDMEYLEGEDGELSWFNAGVRVGVGIGLSISLGVGIGVGLLVRTYQGTAGNFRRRLL